MVSLSLHSSFLKRATTVSTVWARQESMSGPEVQISRYSSQKPLHQSAPVSYWLLLSTKRQNAAERKENHIHLLMPYNKPAQSFLSYSLSLQIVGEKKKEEKNLVCLISCTCTPSSYKSKLSWTSTQLYKTRSDESQLLTRNKSSPCTVTSMRGGIRSLPIPSVKVYVTLKQPLILQQPECKSMDILKEKGVRGAGTGLAMISCAVTGISLSITISLPSLLLSSPELSLFWFRFCRRTSFCCPESSDPENVLTSPC